MRKSSVSPVQSTFALVESPMCCQSTDEPREPAHRNRTSSSNSDIRNQGNAFLYIICRPCFRRADDLLVIDKEYRCPCGIDTDLGLLDVFTAGVNRLFLSCKTMRFVAQEHIDRVTSASL